MSELSEILNLINPDPSVLKKGRERQAAVWKGIEPDHLPLLLSDSEVPELAVFSHYTLKEQFFDKEKMLAEQLKGLVGIAKANSDAQLSVRANLGVGVVATVFGLKPVFPQEDQMPWFLENPPKEMIAYRVSRIANAKTEGLIPTAVEYIEYFRRRLPENIKLYCYDTQGPFDLAHLIRGSQIYTDVFDDPEFVRRILEISTELYIRATKVYKEAVSEPLHSGFHTALFMENGGVRMCDDSSINLSPKLFREFSLPYISKALAPFSGGWVHFCGNANHLFDMYMEVKEIRGINFGNPEKYDYAAVMEKLISKGKFYFGTWPMQRGESLKDYFSRMLKPLKGKRGLILQFTRAAGMPPASEIIKLWQSLQ